MAAGTPDTGPTIAINENMSNPDKTPGTLDLTGTRIANFIVDTHGQEAAYGKAVVTGDKDSSINVTGNTYDVKLIERLPGSDTTRVVASPSGLESDAKNPGNVDIRFVGPEDIRFALDQETHGKAELADKLAGVEDSMPVKDRAFDVGIKPLDFTTTIESDVIGKPDVQFTNGNDKASYRIADNASGSMTVDMGRGDNDTLTLKAKDGRLVTLDNGDHQFIRELAGKRFVMDIKGVENINVVFESGPTSTPNGQAAAPVREGGR